MKQQKVVVIGKSGQLANELLDTVPGDFDVVALGRSELNLSDYLDVVAKLDKEKPDIVINTAAYTQVDKAESDVEAAYELNAEAVLKLARYCKGKMIPLLHVSTDFVFDGKGSEPYGVDTALLPDGVYGQSKAKGEKLLLEEYSENSSIIRTSWLYSVHGNNFVKTMLRLMRERDELGVVVDQIGSPTWAKGLALFLWQLCKVESRLSIYHWSDAGSTTWYDFAVKIKELSSAKEMLTQNPTIKAITAKDFGAPAPRPSYSVMNCDDSYILSPGYSWEQQLSNMLSSLRFSEGHP